MWPAARRVGDVLLRQGAWYPVLSGGATQLVLDVSGRRVAVEIHRALADDRIAEVVT